LPDVPEQLSHLSQSAAAALITEVWQGMVVAACLAICLKLAPRTTAAHRFGIWTAGLLTIAGVPFLPFLGRLIAGFPHVDGLAGSAVRPWLEVDARWSLILAALWAGASLLRAVDLTFHSYRLRKLWKSARPVESGSMFSASLSEALTVSSRRRVQLCTTTQLERPGVIGFLVPRILIPEWLFKQITPAELDQIVLHETEHLRRGDDWTNLLQKLTLVLFPLSPALLWIERRLCLEREMACDEGVIRRTHAPRAYAECLASLAERGLEHRAQGLSLGALSLGAWQRRSELVQRVHSILKRGQVLHPIAARGLMTALGCSLLLGSVELARCPQVVAFLPVRPAETARVASPAQYDSVIDNKASRTFGHVVRTMAAGPSTPLSPSPERSKNVRGQNELKTAAPVRASYSSASLAAQDRAERAPLRKDAVPTLVASNTEASPSAVRVEMLKAKVSVPQQADAVTDADASDQGQGWIVLTTWEQVQSTDVASGAVTPDSDDGATQPSKQNTGQSNAHMTITRMILRVIPANAYAGQGRTGWLVFHL